MSGLGISRLILFVDDMDRMLAFYRDVIGLTLLPGADPASGFVSLDAGGCQLSLHSLPKRSGAEGKPATPRLDAYAKVVFYAEDVEAAGKELEARGAKMRLAVKFGAITLLDGTDPEGNVFQISNRR